MYIKFVWHSEFCTVAMFVTVDLQKTLYIEYVNMFVVYLHTKFHIPSSSCSLIIAIKLKAEENFHIAVMVLF
jgi:hypothetical protein